MLDLRLRSVKDRAVLPLANAISGRVPPYAITAASFVLCVLAGVFAWRELPALAVPSWLLGRALDGLDGPVARIDGTASDLGGYSDFVLDTVGYAVVPLGIAFGANTIGTWQVVGIVMATFFVNSVSLLMFSALLEKRSAGAAARGESTSVAMPQALIEGTETIVLFAIALAFPSVAPIVFGVMAGAVVIGVVQRGIAARRVLVD